MMRHIVTLQLLLVVLLASCAEKETSNPTERFWSWFDENSQRFQRVFSAEHQALRKEDESTQAEFDAAYHEIVHNLEEVNPAFSPYIGGPKDQANRNFIVTVFGDASLFEEVDAFVASAPEIAGWNFIALKPSSTPSPGTQIRTGTTTIELDQSRFVATQAGNGRIDLVVYLHKGIDSATPKASGLARTLTIDFIGERLAGSALGEVTIEDLEKAPSDAIPFLKVKETVEALVTNG